MSILVKGMDMPKDCVSCRWHERWGCELTGIGTNTAEGCPLVSIPTPHGRLIDAEALIKVLNACKYSVEKATMRQVTYNVAISGVCRNIDRLPTIIEAEEEEGE